MALAVMTHYVVWVVLIIFRVEMAVIQLIIQVLQLRLILIFWPTQPAEVMLIV